MSRQVFQSPLFERKKKRPTKAEIAVLDNEIQRICKTPEVGAPKKGDLAGVFVHNVKVHNRLFLLAYEYDENELLLLALGEHENFHRDLKRFLT